jgi:hypothetical protein
MAEEETLYFYKKNVPYPVGVRFFVKDPVGKTLTDNDPYVAVEAKKLRDFRRANKRHILDGLLIETDEPDFDEETPNAITDAQAESLVKNVVALKKALKEITSDAAVIKLLEEARLQGRSSKTIELIETRLREIVGESPADMRGVSWDTQGEVNY